jgi:LysM repeat protein
LVCEQQPCHVTSEGAAIAAHVHRLMRHLWVLAVAGMLVVLLARPTAVPAAPMLRNLAAIQINAVVENSATVTALAVRPARNVVVQPGQSLAALSTEYGVSTSTIRWGNRLTPSMVPGAGSMLLVPPGPGALVEVLPGETPTRFAARMHLDPAVILEYNRLSNNSPMTAGSFLVVPLTRAPFGSLIASFFVDAGDGIPGVPAATPLADHFPYGQCTYYLATRRAVSWGGNAVEWWWSARGHRPEGQVPVQGAIVVLNIGWVGHVAYVEHVNLDGTFVVSEMNYRAGGGGWGHIDYRTISASDPSILGFIY